MPSQALVAWRSRQQHELDQLEAAHMAVGGPGPGRRMATQRINDAYILLLAAAFQHYCRNLHTEAARAVAATTPHVREMVEYTLLTGRQLDRANATPSSIRSDFQRLGLDLWKQLEQRDPGVKRQRRRLEQLNVWRNAIAHGDLVLGAQRAATVAGTARTLAFAQSCRRCCDSLAHEFDTTIHDHLERALGAPPW